LVQRAFGAQQHGRGVFQRWLGGLDERGVQPLPQHRQLASLRRRALQGRLGNEFPKRGKVVLQRARVYFDPIAPHGLARHGDDEQFVAGEGVVQQHGGGVQHGQVACVHQFGEGAGSAAFQREGGLLGLLLVEGELCLEGIGVEVCFGEGGFGFGVWDGAALGFVDGEGACEVLLGLWVVFLLAGEAGEVLERACYLQRVGGEFFFYRQCLLIILLRTRQVATISSHKPQIGERACHLQRVGGELFKNRQHLLPERLRNRKLTYSIYQSTPALFKAAAIASGRFASPCATRNASCTNLCACSGDARHTQYA
jgi:hypothetical protein